jgi:DNA-binding transcriptional ArsR family regulator
MVEKNLQPSSEGQQRVVSTGVAVRDDWDRDSGAQPRHGSRTVGELVDAVNMAQSAVSHQLRVLREMSLVVAERQGRQVLYSLHDDHVASLLDEVVFHVEHLDPGTVED